MHSFRFALDWIPAFHASACGEINVGFCKKIEMCAVVLMGFLLPFSVVRSPVISRSHLSNGPYKGNVCLRICTTVQSAPGAKQTLNASSVGRKLA